MLTASKSFMNNEYNKYTSFRMSDGSGIFGRTGLGDYIWSNLILEEKSSGDWVSRLEKIYKQTFVYHLWTVLKSEAV